MTTQYEHFIGGEHRAPASGEYFEVESPIDGKPVAKVAFGNSEDVEKAVQSTSAAALSWRNMEPMQRGRIMVDIARKLREETGRLAAIERESKPVNRYSKVQWKLTHQRNISNSMAV